MILAARGKDKGESGRQAFKQLALCKIVKEKDKKHWSVLSRAGENSAKKGSSLFLETWVLPLSKWLILVTELPPVVLRFPTLQIESTYPQRKYGVKNHIFQLWLHSKLIFPWPLDNPVLLALA